VTEKNPKSADRIKEPSHPGINTKPLPQILDEMDGNIRAAAEAARKAEEAARAAKQAAADAQKASLNAEKRAEEARQAGQMAAEKATRATAETAVKSEETAKTARLAAVKKAEQADIRARVTTEAIKKATEDAIQAAAETKISTKVNSIEKRLGNIEDTLEEGRTYNAVIYELNNPQYSLSTPIQIIIIEDKEEIIARIPELNLYATGDTDTEAIYNLKSELIELYEELNNTEYKLGPLPKSWLATINKLMLRIDD
jgi:hypothetical protein